MSARSVKFYFDYNSPYSYLASLFVEEACARHNGEVDWRPMVIGGVFQSHGTAPPHTIPVRRAYLNEDLKRLAAYHNVPYRERTTFLFHPVLSLRCTLATPAGDERSRAVHALFKGAFADDLDLGDAEVVVRLLDEAGLDGQALVERTQDDAIKNELRTNTEQAVAQGVFGAPAMVTEDGCMFWGHDRLHLLEHHLQSMS